MSGKVYPHLYVVDSSDTILEHVCKGFGNTNPITVMDKADTFDRLVPPIRVSLINIGLDVGTQLSLEFQLLFHLHDMRI